MEPETACFFLALCNWSSQMHEMKPVTSILSVCEIGPMISVWERNTTHHLLRSPVSKYEIEVWEHLKGALFCRIGGSTQSRYPDSEGSGAFPIGVSSCVISINELNIPSNSSGVHVETLQHAAESTQFKSDVVIAIDSSHLWVSLCASLPHSNLIAFVITMAFTLHISTSATVL